MKPKKLKSPTLAFTAEQTQQAFDEWGCNCGPGALAAMTGTTPNFVRPHILKFNERRYTNPKMMLAALESLKVPHKKEKPAAPHMMSAYGINRIQWEGPWYGRFAYHKTHWTGSMIWECRMFIFDINSGWTTQQEWEAKTVPELTALYKRATGAWHVTHWISLWP
jgi:hypothetical protein